MRVLHITTSYPDFAGSMRGVFIRKLCVEQMKKGVTPIVLTPRIFRESLLRQDDGGIQVYRFPFPSGGRPLHQASRIPVVSMVFFMASGLAQALGLVRASRPDVIHGHWVVPTGLIAAVASRITGVPVLATAHGMDLRISERKFLRVLFDLTVKLSTKTVVVNPSMRKRRSLRDADVIPMGVDETFFTIEPDRSSKTVVYTRSLEPVYGVETLIRSIPLVVESIPEARFLIAGEGSLRSSLEELVRRTPAAERVTFLGRVPAESVPGLLARASVFVSPALADGTSPALLEAMAAGLTPVVSDIAPNRELVSNAKDGYLFRPGDERDLASKTALALSGGIPPSLLEDKRSSLKNSVAWGVVADRFIFNYKLLLKGTCGQP